MPALSGPELALLGADGHKARFYLSVSTPRTLLAGLVNGSLARGAMTIPYDNGTGSGFADIAAGQVFRIVTATGPEYGRVLSVSGSQSSGNLSIAANSIVTSNNEIFEVIEDYPIVPKPPRFTASTFYKDWTITYPGDGVTPVIIAGPHRPQFLSGGSAVFDVDLTSSYAVAQGATMNAASYAATVTPSSGVTVSLTNGVGTITITNPGQYWVRYSATDSSGRSQISRRRYWVHDPDPTDADYPYTDFEVQSLSGGWERGGWVLAIRVHGVANPTVFPEGGLVCLWYAPSYGATQQYIGGPANGEQVLFCGYIRKGSIEANWEDGTVSFEAQTPQDVLRSINMRSVPLQATQSPSKWYEYNAWLTNGRGLHHYYRYHSTLLEVCDFFGLTDVTYGRAGMVFQKGDMYGQALNVVRDYGAQESIVCNKAGQLYLTRDIQLLDDATRAARPVVADLEKSYRQGTITLVERQHGQVALVYVEGIAFDGLNANAYCAKSPGHVPEQSGPGFVEVLNQTVASQDQTNSLAGRIDARENNHDPEARIDLDGIWAAVLDVALQEWYTLSLAAADTTRGVVWTDRKLVLRQVNNRIDPANGYIGSEAIYEPEALGPVGIGDPCVELPEPPDPPVPKWSGAGLAALLAFSSANYRDDNAGDWTELQAAPYNHGCYDPWSQIKSGSSNPRDATWWAVGNGVIYRVVGIGGIPEDRTPVSDPPNTWSDATAPTVGELEFIWVGGSRWVKNRFCALARWQEAGGDWRGWLLVTGNDGFTWDYVELYDGETLPDQLYPTWVAVNGSYVLVSAWVDITTDELRLLVFDDELNYIDTVALGAASLAEVEARELFAFPATVGDDDDLWYVAGRMIDPAGLSGEPAYQAIETANAGTDFTSIEDGWGADVAMALAVDDGDNFFGVRHSVSGDLAIGTSVKVTDGEDVARPFLIPMATGVGVVAYLTGAGIIGKVVDVSSGAPVVGSEQTIAEPPFAITFAGMAVRQSDTDEGLAVYTQTTLDKPETVAFTRSGNTLTPGTPFTDSINVLEDAVLGIYPGSNAALLGDLRGGSSDEYVRIDLVTPAMGSTNNPSTTIEYYLDAVAMDGDDVMVAFADTSRNLYFQMVNITGPGISQGTASDSTIDLPSGFSQANMINYCLCRLTDTAAVACAPRDLATDALSLVVVTRSGTTISGYGTPLDVYTDGGSGVFYGHPVRVSDTEFRLFYRDASGAIGAQSFSVSGTTISAAGDTATGATGWTQMGGAALLDTDKLAICWEDDAGDIRVALVTPEASASFYQGAGGLSAEKFALASALAGPGGLALRGDGIVALGGTTPGSGLVVRAGPGDSYAAATDVTGSLTEPINGLAWIGGGS